MTVSVARGGHSALIVAVPVAWCLGAAPAHAELDFEVHEIGDWGNGLGQTCLADVDHDGDLDFFSGTRAGVPSPSENTVSWWEYRGPDDWVRHEVGSGHGTDVGGVCHDVDGDGWVDQISGHAWFRNDHDGTFTRHGFGGIESHDMRIVQLGDGYGVASLSDEQTSVKLYRVPADPTKDWPETDVGDWSDADDTDNQPPHSGLTVCDINGDGREDLVVYNRWYENDGDGSGWTRHDIPYTHHVSRYYGTLSDCADLDGDGDPDVGMSDHDGSWGVWAENVDGSGTSWTVHELTRDRDTMHSLQIADFDNDGDYDIYMGDTGNPGESGTFAIFENDGDGGFTERLFPLDVPGHETRAADVDQDGDIDLVSKPWDYNDSSNEGRHVYLRNLCIENGTCEVVSEEPDAGMGMADAGTAGGEDGGVDSGSDASDAGRAMPQDAGADGGARGGAPERERGETAGGCRLARGDEDAAGLLWAAAMLMLWTGRRAKFRKRSKPSR